MISKVDGADKGRLMLYALSTCIWCKKIKSYLEENKISFEYIYVDQVEASEKDSILQEVKKWNPACSFPILVINEQKCLLGFDEDEIKKELGL